jgi:hypothetical protein
MQSSRSEHFVSMDSVDCLEVGTGMPSFPSLNQMVPRSDCLEVGTGAPSFSSLLTNREHVDDRHQPSYSSMCLASSTFGSVQCSIEGTLSFPFSSKTPYDVKRKRGMGCLCEQECEHPSKCTRTLGDSGWRRAGEQQHCSIEDIIQRKRNRKEKKTDRKGLELYHASDEPCPRPLTDSHQREVEAFSIGSGDPFGFSPRR